MSELGPQARALLDGARRGAPTPTPEEAARLWDRVGDSIAKAASGGATIGAASKFLIAIAIVTATGTSAALLAPSRTSQPTSAEPRADQPPASSLFSRDRTQSISEQPEPPPPAPIPVEELPRARGVAASIAAPTDDGDIAMVRAAYQALRRGDAAGALALAVEHARRHPSSALSEERDATRVLALCALGQRDQARDALQRFRRAFPTSSQLARTCADDGAPR